LYWGVARICRKTSDKNEGRVKRKEEGLVKKGKVLRGNSTNRAKDAPSRGRWAPKGTSFAWPRGEREDLKKGGAGARLSKKRARKTRLQEGKRDFSPPQKGEGAGINEGE